MSGQPRPAQPLPPQDELLVTFKPDTPETRREAIHRAVGATIVSQMLGGRIAHVKLPQGKALAEAQSAYAQFPEVEAAEPNAPVGTEVHEKPTR
jgi:hypothetical protein